jgi:hypothetical protein
MSLETLRFIFLALKSNDKSFLIKKSPLVLDFTETI